MARRETKTRRLQIRASAEQLARWKKAAMLDRRTLSQWVEIMLDDAAELVLGGGK